VIICAQGIFRDYTPDSPKGEEDIVRTV